MSDPRPRRGLAEDEASADNSWDDTPSEPRSGARRVLRASGPGVRASEPPRPVLPDHDWPDDGEGYVPRRSALSATEPFEVLPRRSAPSADIDDEPDDEPLPDEVNEPPAPPARRSAPSAPSVLSAPSAPVADEDAPSTERKTRIAWLVGVVLLALVIFVTALLLSRRPPKVLEVGLRSQTTAQAPQFGESTLADVEDLSGLVTGASWQIAATTDSVGQDSPQAACIVQDSSMPTPNLTRQRTLTASANNAAMLHQLEVFPSAAEAQSAYKSLLASLADCDPTPATIAESWLPKGLADDAAMSTVAYQNQQTTYHTVLLTRSGTTVSVMDAAQDKTPIDPQKMVAAAGAVLKRSCSAGQGACPQATVTLAPTAPFPGSDPGWLKTADLPRITPGSGRWTAAAPAPISNEGTACENVDLSTVTGPTQRSNRTYLMTQDPKTTANFGIDSMRFTFADPTAASNFAKQLNAALASCAGRMPTATVGDASVKTTKDADGTTISATIRNIVQAQSKTEKLNFRTSVVQTGTVVVYTVGVVDPAYNFTDDQWTQIALRSGQRASQA